MSSSQILQHLLSYQLTHLNPAEPLAQWDADQLVKAYLKAWPEPFRDLDYTLLRARLQMLRTRIVELEQLRNQYPPNRRNVALERDLASVLFKRKILLWLVFPIRDLPTEILNIIFRYVVWSSDGVEQATEHRLTLTWTCRRFRAVALADRTLWNSVWFRDAAPWKRSLAFIERAGNATLDIRINEKERPPVPAPAPGQPAPPPPPAPPLITVQQINQLLDSLVQKVPQIRILVVILQDMDVVETFLRRFAAAGPPRALERFELHRTGSPLLWPKEKSIGSGGIHPLSAHAAPKLRWLALNGVSIDWNRLQPALIRTLDLRRLSHESCPSSERWSRLLQESPELYKLALDSAAPQWFPQRGAHVRPVSLPNLRDLTLGNMSCIFAIHTLLHMQVPGVMSLNLVSLIGQDYGPLFEYLSGTFKEVRYLQASSVDIAPTDQNMRRMIRFFDNSPHLKYLKVAQVKSIFLDALVCDPRPTRNSLAAGEEEQSPVLCPELRTLYFSNHPIGEIISLVQRREHLQVRFKNIYMPSTNQVRLTQEEFEKLRPHADHVESVWPMYVTPEEDAIYDEMANSIGVERKHKHLIR
ncbi:hypothetical protein BD413DRAFT_107003 [Trametes elegans]|nr:hypothetical protein BD413DRAFT_107003 [Trametes elegans]